MTPPLDPPEQATTPETTGSREALDRWARGLTPGRDRMLAAGRDFGVPLLLLVALGTYLLFQRRLDRGPLPMSGALHSVDGARGDEHDARYDL